MGKINQFILKIVSYLILRNFNVKWKEKKSSTQQTKDDLKNIQFFLAYKKRKQWNNSFLFYMNALLFSQTNRKIVNTSTFSKTQTKTATFTRKNISDDEPNINQSLFSSGCENYKRRRKQKSTHNLKKLP